MYEMAFGYTLRFSYLAIVVGLTIALLLFNTMFNKCEPMRTSTKRTMLFLTLVIVCLFGLFASGALLDVAVTRLGTRGGTLIAYALALGMLCAGIVYVAWTLVGTIAMAGAKVGK
jgi:hypothetical protein